MAVQHPRHIHILTYAAFPVSMIQKREHLKRYYSRRIIQRMVTHQEKGCGDPGIAEFAKNPAKICCMILLKEGKTNIKHTEIFHRQSWLTIQQPAP